ncbi:MAG: lysine-2,3-aminomutase-like protein [Rhodospirillaceae bacterium]|nr:MAG: lysine-2,3-aminomutase-like protein [Rhodospirillaceae bacterium]
MDAFAAKTLQTVEDFRDAGLVAPELVPALNAVAARYVAAVPPILQTAIAETGRDGPIARQFVPSPAELTVAPDERGDPIGDAAHSPIKGIVHRYPDRVLLMPTHVCAVYCRFCFRREAVGPDAGILSAPELDAAVAYIARTPAVWEVILTGGDPLVLSSRRLGDIVRRLDAIPHVRVLRVHTRVPVAAPERIDSMLIDTLRASTKAVYVAIHCNHPAELTGEAVAACARLADAGLSLLSQSVLLKGVNDSVDTLEQLMRTLVSARVKPYYLHHLDLAPGTSHFRVPVEEGQALMRALRTRVSGLALPTYVLDIPGGFGKVPIGPTYIEPAAHSYAVDDRTGVRHVYPPVPE